MHNKLALAVLALAWLAAAQPCANVELNCFIDNEGEIWVNGGRVIPPRKATDTTSDTSSMPITVHQGLNAIAVKVHDSDWTAGMCASVDLSLVVPGGDTLVSDGTWKCMDVRRLTETGATISTAAYQSIASSWLDAGDYGFLADDTGAFLKPWIGAAGDEWANLIHHKVKWVWTPRTIFIRKEFTKAFGAAAPVGTVYLRGNGFTYRAYLNGRLVGEQTTEQNLSSPLRTYADQALTYGTANVIAIEATCVDDIDFAFVKAGVQWQGPGMDCVLSDTTWKYSWAGEAGWNDTGFNDSQWAPCGVKRAYDGYTDPLDSAKFLWATDMWFYKQFSAGEGAIRHVKAPAPSTKSLRTEYFTLGGRRTTGTSLRGANCAVVVERSVSSGHETAARIPCGR